MPKIDLSVIILNFNTKQITLDCLKSVFQYTRGINYEVIVVDNASTDGSVTAIQNFQFPLSERVLSNFQLIRNKKNLGFAGGNNVGIRKASGRYVVLLNSDTYLNENSPRKMVEFMDKHEDVGISSCRLENPDGTTQATGGFFPTLPRVFAWMFFLDDLPLVSSLLKSVHPSASSLLYKKDYQLDWVTGAFFLIRREVVDDIGLLDEGFFMYVEDLEYCYRAKKKGWQIFYTTITNITHIGGASGASENTIIRELKNLKLFYQKHQPVWKEKVLAFLLKTGILLRIFLFRILPQKREGVTAYEKAYRTL